MIEIHLQGPYVLLSNDSSLPNLFSREDTSKTGLFILCFEFNRAHRVHEIGVAKTSIVDEMLSLISDTLAGRRTVFSAEKCTAGELAPIAKANADRATFCAVADDALAQLRNLHVFYATDELAEGLMQDISHALLKMYIEYGGIALSWLEPRLKNAQLSEAKSKYAGETIRFHRPAFIASLPDELHL